MVTYRLKTMGNDIAEEGDTLESDDDVVGSSEEEVLSDDSALVESDSDED